MMKKGSLNLSIQAIVIVVIAFVVLGLGLGFVRGQFKSITETSSSVQDQIRAQILEDLRTGNKKLSFPASTLNIERGDAQDIAIGVKNVKNGDLSFTIAITTIKNQENPDATEDELASEVTYFLNEGPFTLGPTDAEAYNIRISAEGSTGTYLVNLKITDQADPETPYAEKSFFVNVI
jgi:hypothetical protein